MNEKIRDALSALDPNNAEHWTGQGLPSMAVVCHLLGETVTRKQVEEAAPGFCRTDLGLPAEGNEGMVSYAEDAQPVESDGALEVRHDERSQAEHELQKRMADLQVARAAALEQMKAAKVAADIAEREMEVAKAKFEAEHPPLTQAQEYQLILKRSFEERLKRVQTEAAARAVLGQGGKSPLDRAMSSRRGYGLTRPVYPLVTK